MLRTHVMKWLLLLVLVPVAAARPQGTPPPAMAPRDFPVMAWGTSPSDPEQLRGMKEAGLNISGFCSADDVDRVSAAGLGCFVSDERVNGYDWEKLPAEEQIRTNIDALVRQVSGNAAVLGFFLRDEPSTLLMPGLGRVAAMLREAAPDRWPYVNLFPLHANAAQMGTKDYEAYLRRFVETVHPLFLTYDNYSLVEGEMHPRFFTNLEIFRRLSLETQTPFWNCILANSHFNYMEPSDATFNLQVYSTLAYGGRGIQYFTYFAPAVGNYRLAAIDAFGNRTATWDLLRRINYQIHALAPTLIQLRSTGVYHSAVVPPQGRPLAESRLVERVEMTTVAARPPIPARFLVGEFEDQQNHPYLMLVNKDLRHSFLFHIRLKQAGRKLFRVSPYSGKEEAFEGEMDWLAPGAGVLLRVE